MTEDRAAADLRHVDTWLFDLDNTLYPVESGFLQAMGPQLTAFVAQVCNLPMDEAFVVQKKYFMEYGLTLRGLMLHHDVQPADFHMMYRDMPLELLARDPAMIAALEALPGRRLIFTNADDVHAERVLDHLGLAHLFDDVFHIGSFGYLPKPDPQAFIRMNAEHGIDPRTTAFFEDSERNLEPAADLGMTTVLVGPKAPASTAPFVHHRTTQLASFLANAQLQKAA